MRSKAHHRKCHELKIIPVPTTVDDCQIDKNILERQQQLSKIKVRIKLRQSE